MKILFILLSISCFSIGCTKNKIEKTSLDSIPSDTIAVQKAIPYAEFLTQLKNSDLYKTNRKERFFDYINTDIPNYWIGTPWSFGGTTQKPQEGTIACGYFVTNVLSDFGISLNRIGLAQQASSVMIKQLCAKNSIKHFAKYTDVESYMKNRNAKEIYIVGLDFHTGFLIRDNDSVYFLHSNYINKKGVTKELLSDSQAFQQSKSFMLGSLSDNNKLFE